MLTDRYLEGTPEDSRIIKSGVFLKSSDLTQERLQQINQLNDIAKARGQSLAQMALSWVLRDGEVTSVLIGASKPSQISDNLESINNIDFDQDELKKIDRIVC
jgi:L-glyceraldehyde 3-phosphate reductase